MKLTLKKSLLILFFITLFCMNFSAEKVSAQTETPSAPANLTYKTDASQQSVLLTWQYNLYTSPYADGFIIYKSTSLNGEYSYVDDIYSSYYSDTYSISDDIKPGVTYYYKVIAYVEDDENYTILKGPEVNTGMIKIPLASPVIKSVTSAHSHSAEIKWSPVTYADGYYIYRSTSPDKGFTYIHTYTSSENNYNYNWFYNSFDYDDFDYNTLTYTDKNLTVGQTYYYKICAFVTYNNQNFCSSLSFPKSTIIRIDSAKITKSYSKKKSTNTIRWNKISEADGYMVYYSKKYNGTYKKIKTIKGNNTISFTHKKVKNGTAYYYKVYSYKYINRTFLTGIEPDIYQKYCDYYSYANESYESRYKRIWGGKGSGRYKSNKKALKNMKTIKIKVWDINSRGKKYTRKFSLTVHKNIAPSMKQMFKEIYKSKEKFPIHDIGCYSWRGKNSYSEHCIGVALDINANENYMIEGKKILAGSFWKPKKNKYSIPLKCKLVTILEKYGFSRGFWGERKDYMHFSYFGT